MCERCTGQEQRRALVRLGFLLQTAVDGSLEYPLRSGGAECATEQRQQEIVAMGSFLQLSGLLQRHTDRRAAMPSFAPVLTASQLADGTAFLLAQQAAGTDSAGK